MQIQLKQTEIIAALKGYIASQGINLAGKNVEISFTASRGAAGIVADIEINDAAQAAVAGIAAIAPMPNIVAQAAVAAPEAVAVAEEATSSETKAAPAASLFN